MANQINSENVKQKKKALPKILFVIIAILLMVGVAFVVANIVHSRNTVPVSSNVKDGLSAYELAVEQGFSGSLEDWLKSLESRSAYEIAAENGYKGTEKEWNKALAEISNQNAASIKSAEFSSKGELLITLSDGTTINVGAVAGTDGKDGVNGKNGADGKNGVNGKDGIDGKGISSAFVNEKDQLILKLSDGSSINLDKIVGPKGAKGENGADGKDGIGIHDIEVADNGALTVTLTNGTVLNLGNIKGTDGIGILKSEINSNGELILTYTNGETVNLGKVTNTDGENSTDSTGIKNVTMSSNGELIITLTDNSVLNLGNVKGEKGDKGDKGENGTDGKDGRGITDLKIVDGNLIVNYTDGTSENIGKASQIGEVFNVSCLKFTVLPDDTLGVSLASGSKYTELTSIEIPEEYNGRKVTEIMDNGFSNMKYLNSVSIPNTIINIGKNAFSGCNKINEINLPIHLETIGSYAFSCSSLTRVVIPKSVQTIGYGAFHANLKELYFADPESEWKITTNGSVKVYKDYRTDVDPIGYTEHTFTKYCLDNSNLADFYGNWTWADVSNGHARMLVRDCTWEKI